MIFIYLQLWISRFVTKEVVKAFGNVLTSIKQLYITVNYIFSLLLIDFQSWKKNAKRKRSREQVNWKLLIRVWLNFTAISRDDESLSGLCLVVWCPGNRKIFHRLDRRTIGSLYQGCCPVLTDRNLDLCNYLSNCTPTPPLTQHWNWTF